MEQRRLRVGDHIDDYCPRERRLTNHAIVAMVGDTVRQTRCTTCDAEHVYKKAKVPPKRKPKEVAEGAPPAEPRALGTLAPPTGTPPAPQSAEPPLAAAPSPPEDAPASAPESRAADDEGPVHRRLIRAVLPRAEGQVPVRQMPEFTMRQPGVRHPDLVAGNGRRGRDADHWTAAPFKGGQGRASRHGKSGRPGGAPHGSHHGHGQRRGRHAGGKKRSR